MAYWDSTQQKIVYFGRQCSKHYPAWDEVDCSCCGGVKWWGGECRDCTGNGVIFLHRTSGALAAYPGGPFCGKNMEIVSKLKAEAKGKK